MAKTKKDKRTNNDLQNTTHNTKDRPPLKIGDQLMCSGRVINSCYNSDTSVVISYKPGVIRGHVKNKSVLQLLINFYLHAARSEIIFTSGERT